MPIMTNMSDKRQSDSAVEEERGVSIHASLKSTVGQTLEHLCASGGTHPFYRYFFRSGGLWDGSWHKERHLPCKSGILSLIPRTYIEMEGENQLHKIILWCLYIGCGVCKCRTWKHTCACTQNNAELRYSFIFPFIILFWPPYHPILEVPFEVLFALLMWLEDMNWFGIMKWYFWKQSYFPLQFLCFPNTLIL